ncbi:hypothetical protein DICPUDRAFT_10731, partial [Dictyostelium purpureum]
SSSIYLNIYDLYPKINRIGDHLGLGIYHTGVQINTENYIAEYCFGCHPYDFSGVFLVEPKKAKGFIFRESIYMGEINMIPADLDRLIETIGNEFTGKSYHFLKKNCNSFSNELIKRLINKEIPVYLNRL